jgi:hypothetical protein
VVTIDHEFLIVEFNVLDRVLDPVLCENQAERRSRKMVGSRLWENVVTSGPAAETSRWGIPSPRLEPWRSFGHASAMDLVPRALAAFFLLLVAGWVNRQQQDVIDYLLEENRVLRAAHRHRRQCSRRDRSCRS